MISGLRYSAFVLAAIVMAACNASTPTGPTGRTADNLLTYARPAGQFIGAESGRLHPPDALFETSVRDNRNAVDVSVRTIQGASCHLSLAAPRGQVMAPGVYVDAARHPFQSPPQPGLDFACGYGCNRLQGQFVIESVAFGADGNVDRLRATFEQSCLRWDGVREVPMEKLTGEIRFVRGAN